MELKKLCVYYPNGQPMMEIGPITDCSVSDIIQLAAAGMNDIMSKMPQLTKYAEDMFAAYQKAKSAGATPPGAPTTEIVNKA
jgi:hypothetical protein